MAIKLTIPHPYPLDWFDWLDTFVGLNVVIPGSAFSDNSDWMNFADRLSQFVPDTPTGSDFDSWQDWVLALRSSLSL